jgi:hypothetical protein
MTQMQQAYEKIRAHLIEQGRPATNRSGGCVYRNSGGLKCAVGCLISDEAYHEALEDCTPMMDNVIEALEKSDWVFTHFELQCLKEMQEKHDSWRGGLDGVIRDIDQVAKSYGLEVVK